VVVARSAALLVFFSAVVRHIWQGYGRCPALHSPAATDCSQGLPSQPAHHASRVLLPDAAPHVPIQLTDL
jgi:hypothetical protein